MKTSVPVTAPSGGARSQECTQTSGPRSNASSKARRSAIASGVPKRPMVRVRLSHSELVVLECGWRRPRAMAAQTSAWR